MNLAQPLVTAIAFALVLSATAEAKTATKYPKAPMSKQVDTYHGTKVADPYRPLENPDSPESRKWIEEQNKLTEGFLTQVPERDAIRKRLTKLWNYERYSPPYNEGGRTFFSKNDGLQNQAVLYVQDGPAATPRVLLDPNTLTKDGTVALSGVSVSMDGKYLAYGLAASGSDWNEWKVRDVATAKDTEDHLKWVKFSGASWTNDGKGFFYSRYDAPGTGKELEAVNKNQKVYYHRVGTKQEADVLVYARPDQPEYGFGAGVTDDGKYLVMNVAKGTDRRNRLYFKELQADPQAGEMKRLFEDFDADYTFVGNEGSNFFFRTDLDAPKGRIVAVDVATWKGGKPTLKTLIPQGDGVIQGVSHVGGRLVIQLSKDASERIHVFATNGTFEKEIALPTFGTVGGLGGRATDMETYYSFTSFTFPTTIYRYDFKTGTSEIFKQPKVDFDPAAFETKQIFYPSKDGTKIPLFITHKKGLKLDGNNPTYLYGYGGFNVPLTPGMSVRNLAWMEMGGVYAQASLRGGSEYGEEWHRDGMLDKKQNVFDDFAWAGKWLIANGYTSPAKLSIGGGSNGGLLVGATLNQHPELFGAAVPAVGVMDMLRFHKFTIGWAWVSDYGSADDPEQFKTLIKYSPIHNIKKGTKYPSVMVTTADHDDRVVPAHSFKYAAAMQAAQGGEAPILIRIETKAGHGAGKPTTKLIDEATDVLSFLWKSLGGPSMPKSQM